MKRRLSTQLTLLSLFCLSSSLLLAQTPGQIFRPTTGGAAAEAVLDSASDGYITISGGAFTTGLPDEQVEFEFSNWKQIWQLMTEPSNDLATGASCGSTEIVDNPNTGEHAGFYRFNDPDGILDNGDETLSFRLRMAGNPGSAAFGFSVLLDTDQKMGNTGPNADPNYVAGNPGFELEILYASGNAGGVIVNNVDGFSAPNQFPTPLAEYPDDAHHQRAYALNSSCPGTGVFMDFYVSFSDLGISATTPLRMAFASSSSGSSALNGSASDIGGVDDDTYPNNDDAFTLIITSSPPLTFGGGYVPSLETVESPAVLNNFCNGVARPIATTVSHYSLSFDGVDDYMEADNAIHNSIFSDDNLSVECWFRTTSTDAVILGFSDQLPTTVPSSFIPTIGVRGGKLYGELWIGANSGVVSVNDVNDGNWHHAAIVSEPTGYRVLLDGLSIGDVAGTLDMSWVNYMTVGSGYADLARSWPSNNWWYMNGEVAEVRVWSNNRSAADVEAQYDTVIYTLTDSLAANFTFGEGSGTTTANPITGLTASLVNGATFSTDLPPVGGLSTGPFTYAWSTGGTAVLDTITPTASGTYYVTITDPVSGTSVIDTIQVNLSTLAATLTPTNPSCNGGNDGSILAIASGGGTSYTYTWSAGTPGSTTTGLSAGTYSLTVTDNLGCSIIETATLLDPAVGIATVSATDPTCNGGTDGSATVTAADGSSPYTYTWDAGTGNQTTVTASSLSVGTYMVTVTASNGCISEGSATLSPASLSATISTTPAADCPGAADGTATVTPTSGISPYSYLWSDGQTTATATGLTAGIYSVTVTDTFSCTNVFTDTVDAQAVTVPTPYQEITIVSGNMIGLKKWYTASNPGTNTASSTQFSFVVPSTVSSIDALVIGGGGGGGGGTANTRGGGGGGGAEVRRIDSLAVSACDVFTVKAGKNGAAGGGNVSGTSGEESFIKLGATTIIQSNPGLAGLRGGSGGTGGAAGSGGSGGTLVYSGQAGITGSTNTISPADQPQIDNSGANWLFLGERFAAGAGGGGGRNCASGSGTNFSDGGDFSTAAPDFTTGANNRAGGNGEGGNDAYPNKANGSINATPVSGSGGGGGGNVFTNSGVGGGNGGSGSVILYYEPADRVTSTLSVLDDTIYATDDTTIVTLQLRGSDGTPANVSVGPVVFSITGVPGILGSVTDNNDGTYTALLLSNNVGGMVYVSATVVDSAFTSTDSVLFLDTSVPTVITRDIIVSLDSTGNISITPAQVDSASSSGVGIDTMFLDIYDFTCANLGVNTVTLTVVDNNGNSSSATATVTIEDNSAPTATIAASLTVYLDTTGNYTVSENEVITAVTDNCDASPVVAISGNSFSCADVGSTGAWVQNGTMLSGNGDYNHIYHHNGTLYGVSYQPGTTEIYLQEWDGSSWQVTSSGYPVTGIQTNPMHLSVDNNGDFLVAYVANSTRNFFVVKYDGTAWSEVVSSTVNSSFNYSDNFRQINGNVNPVTGDVWYTIVPFSTPSGTYQVNALRWDGSSVTHMGSPSLPLTMTSSATWVDNADIDFLSDGTPVVIYGYRNQTANVNCRTMIKTYEGGSWVDKGPISGFIAESDNEEIEITSNDRIYVGFRQLNDSVKVYTTTDFSTWTELASAPGMYAWSLGLGKVPGDKVVAVYSTPSLNVALELSGTTVSDISAGYPSAVYSYPTLSYASGSSYFVSSGSTTGDTYNRQGTSISYTISDVEGNVLSGSIPVTVLDTLAPIAVMTDTTVVLDATGNATIDSTYVIVTVTDNCGVETVSLSQTAFNASHLGANTVTVTVTDVNGNTTTTAVTVTIVDTTPPTITAPADVTVYSDSASCFAEVTNFGTPTVADNTSILGYTNDSASVLVRYPLDDNTDGFSGFGIADYKFPVIANATIASSGSLGIFSVGTDSWSGSVQVLKTSPNVSVSGASQATALSNNWYFEVTLSPVAAMDLMAISADWSRGGTTGVRGWFVRSSLDGYASDLYLNETPSGTSFGLASDTFNLSGFTNINTPVTFRFYIYTESTGRYMDFQNIAFHTTPATFPIGTTTVYWTVQDVSGNAAIDSSSVTVIDTIQPTTTAQNLTVYLDATGNASILTSQIDNGSSDACGIDTMYLDVYDFTCTEVGANTVTLTVVDNNNNVNSATATVTVLDTLLPVSVFSDTTVALDATGNVTIDSTYVIVTVTDNCGVETVALSQTAFNTTHLGANTVTVTVTDVNGNTATTAVTVTIVDITPPTVITRDITVSLDATGNISITAAQIDSASSDAGGIDTMYLDIYDFTCADVGTNIVTLTVVDISGNSASAQSTVTVTDTLLPIPVVTDTTVSLDITGTVTIDSSYINVGSNDNCGIATITLSKYTFTTADIGQNTVTVTVTDVNGNVSTTTAVVTIADIIPPTIIIQDITVYLDGNGQTSITAQDIDNGTNDASGIDTLYLDIYDFDCDDLGPNTVTFYAVDNWDNMDSATAIVTVLDTTVPVIQTRLDVIYIDSFGVGYTSVPLIDAGTTDNCGIDSLWLSRYEFYCNEIALNTLTFYARDNSGNVDSVQQNVVVLDYIAAVVRTQDINVYLDANGSVSIDPQDVDNGSTDNCAIWKYFLDDSTFTCDDLGANTVTLTIRDINTNYSSGTATVTVLDTIKPVVFTQNITVYLDANGQVVVPAAMVDNGSYDNCGIDNRWLDKSTFNCTNVGNNVVRLYVEDESGNVRSKVAIITVVDTVAPVIQVNNPVVLPLGSNGQATLTLAMVDNGTSDNCGIQWRTLSKTSFNCSNIGNNVVVFTVKDNNGNVSSTTVTVQVVDNMAPTVITQDLTVQLDGNGAATITAAMIDNGSTDNCRIASMSLDITDFDCGDVGANMVTLTVTDVNGNVATATATVTVEDNMAPTVITQNITVQLDANGAAVITAAQVDNGSTDNCGIQSMSLDNTDFDCGDVGANMVTLTVTDVNSNVATATATVTVEDNAAPTVITQDITVQLDANGEATITAAQVDNGSSDNCGIQSMSVDNTMFDCGDVGANTVTLTVTDVNGNVATATATVTVVDNAAPTVITQDITVQLDANGTATITAAQVDNGSTDNCGIAGMSLDNTQYDCGDVGANTVTLTVTDVNGNVATATATVTVEDNAAPTVITQDITVQLNANGEATITAAQVDNGSSDNCGIQSMSLDNTDFDCGDVGANTVTLTVTDVNGNSAQATATVTVEDNAAPTVITQDITVQLDANGQATITAAQVDNGSTDNCGIASISVDNMLFDCGDVGANTVTLTVTDVNGNSAQATATVTVVDNAAPIVITQNITVQLNANGQATITAAQVDNGSSDNCGIAGMSVDNMMFDCGDVGANTVTLTVTDPSGNSAQATAVVTVVDNLAPVVTAQDITLYLDNSGQAMLSVADVKISATDNCGIVDEWLSKAMYTCGDVGTNVQYLYAEDGSGNVGSASFLVTVLDTIAPVVVTQPVTLVLNGQGMATLTISQVDNGSSDNCGIATRTLSQTSFSCQHLGINQVTLTVVDGSGNQSQATVVVTVVDNQLPVITCQPAKTLISTDVACGVVWNYPLPTATDNCIVTVLQIGGIPPGTFFPVGVTVNTFQALDQAGNTSSCSQTVTVLDQTAPVFTPQGDITIDLPAQACEATVVPIVPSATDNCYVTGVTQVGGPASGSQLPAGVYTYTFRATDASGNAATTSYKITVRDVTAPVFDPVMAVAVPAEQGLCSAQVTWSAPTATDLCGNATVVQISGPTSGSTLQTGNYVAVYGASDDYGNVSTIALPIAVVDEELPVISQVADITLQAGAGQCQAMASWTAPTATDNCGIATLTASHQPGSMFPVGTTTVTYEATDSYGNIGQMTFTVTVEDVEAPFLSPMADIQLPAQAGQCSAVVTWTLPVTGDNCGQTTLTSSHQPGDVFQVGTTTVTYTSADASGNSTTRTFNVTIVDTEAPVVSVPANITVPADAGQCGAVVQFAVVTATDNCGVTALTGNFQPGDVFPTGTTTVIYVAVDAGGNQSQASFTVTVEDVEAPSITAIADIATCDEVVSWAAPVATDNCGQVTVTSSHQPGSVFAVGTTTVTYEAVDAAGNKTQTSFNVTVWPKAVADAGQDVSVCAGGTTQIGVKGTGGVQYSWLPATGINVPTLSNPGVTPTGTTTYTLTATTDKGCTTTDEVTVTVNALPVVNAGADVTICQGDQVVLGGSPTATGAGGFTYQWTPQSALSGAGIDNPTAGPRIGTTYTVTVTDQNGCRNTDVVVVTVNPLPDAAISGPATVCVDGGVVQYTGATAGGTFSGAGMSGGGQFDPAAAGAGQHTITYTVTNANGCTGTGTITVVVVPSPVVSITGPAEVCPGTSPVFYGVQPYYSNVVWSGPGISAAGQFNPATAGVGVHTIEAQVTSNEGCVTVVSTTVEVLSVPDPSFTIPAAICNNVSPITLQAASAVGFWLGRNTDVVNGTFIPSGLAGGNYPVQRITFNAQGCIAAFTGLIRVEEAPVIAAATVDALCDNSSDGAIDITATGGTGTYAYVWNTGSTTEDLTGLTGGVYTLTVTDGGNGCSSTAAIPVSVQYELELNTVIVGVSNGLQNGSIDLNPRGSGANGATYQWSNGATGSSITGLSAGNYTVTITNQYGCEYVITLTVPVVTGVDKPTEVSESIMVYPNPSAGSFRLIWDRTDSEADASIEVYDMLGRVVYRHEVGTGNSRIEHVIPTDHWSAGAYVLRLRSGDRFISRELIRTR